MDRAEPRFGFCVPVFANPGAAFFRTPAWRELDPALAIAACVEAERLGYDSIWIADHLVHGFDDAILEGWTTLSVIAGRTSSIKLGTIHLAQPFRAPSLMAKMAATLDVLSDGRLILFYDCGWQEAEVRMYGLEWPDEDERIVRMEEGLQLITALWQAESPLDFRGRFYRTEGAVCRPAPVRRPRPPIWLVIDDWLVGTPEAVAEQVAVYQQQGISHFMLWFLDFPSLQGMSLFASHVRPALRAPV